MRATIAQAAMSIKNIVKAAEGNVRYGHGQQWGFMDAINGHAKVFHRRVKYFRGLHFGLIEETIECV